MVGGVRRHRAASCVWGTVRGSAVRAWRGAIHRERAGGVRRRAGVASGPFPAVRFPPETVRDRALEAGGGYGASVEWFPASPVGGEPGADHGRRGGFRAARAGSG